jgi:hypothetical protein
VRPFGGVDDDAGPDRTASLRPAAAAGLVFHDAALP